MNENRDPGRSAAGETSANEGLFADIDFACLQSLYRKFAAIIRLAPWKWLAPHDYFGIMPAGCAEPVFFHFNPAAATGGEDELVLAFGWEASATLRMVSAGALDHPSMHLYEQPIARCRLRSIERMTPVERAFLKMSGFPADARGRAPVFICYRPGWLPWMLKGTDVAFCDSLLDQGLGVLLRSEADDSIVRRADPSSVWVRSTDGKGEWKEAWTPVPPFHGLRPSVSSMPSADLIRKVSALPVGPDYAEVDLDILPQFPFLKPEELSKFKNGLIPLSYFLALCASGPDVRPDKSCICNCIIYSGGNIARMWNEMAGSILEFFIEAGRRPREIAVSSRRMMNFLRPLQTKFRFKLTFHQSLPNYEAVLAHSRAMIQKSLQNQQGGGSDEQQKDS